MRVRRWFLPGILLAVLAAAAGAAVYFRSAHFQSWMSERLCARIADATGSACALERFHLDLLTGRFEVSGLDIGPRQGSTEPLRFHVEKVSGALDWKILWSPKIEMKEMRLIRPRLEFDFAKRRGRDPDALARIIRKSLDFGARTVEVQEGWVIVENQRLPLSLRVEDLSCELRYRPEIPAYAIRIGYRKGAAEWGSRVLSYDLEARAVLKAAGIDVEEMAVRRGRSFMRGTGWLRDWRSPVLLLQGEGTVSAPDLEILHPNLAEIRGEIAVQGNFRWDAEGFRSLGKFAAKNGSYRGAVVKRIEGGYEVRDGVLFVNEATGRIGAGTFEARLSFPYRTRSMEPKRANVTTRGIPLEIAALVLRLPALDFANTIDSESKIEWREGLDDLVIESNVRLRDAGDGAERRVSRQTSMSGEAELIYKGGAWRLTRADLQSADTTIHAEGGGSSGFKIRMTTRKLSEPLVLLQSVSPATRRYLDENADVLQATGSYTLEGVMSLLPGARTEYAGSLKISGARWRAYSADLLDARVRWDGSTLRMEQLQIQRGSERVEGSLSVHDVAEGLSASDVEFSGSARQVALSSLEQIGIEPPLEMSGSISGSGKVSRVAGRWGGEGEVSIGRAMVEGEAFDTIRGRVQWLRDRVLVTQGEAVRKDARAQFYGSYGTDARAMDFSIRLSNFPIQEIPALRSSRLKLDGRISGGGRLSGTTSNLSLDADYTLTGLQYESFDLGSGKGTLRLRDRMLTGEGSVHSELGAFQIDGRVSTDEGYPGKASVRVDKWNVRKILPEDLPPFLREVSTALEGRLEIEGKFEEPSGLIFRGEIDGASFKIHDYELKNSDKIRFEASSQRVRLDPCLVVGEGTRLVLSGTIPMDGSAALNLRLEGALNLKFLEHEETRVRVSGSAQLNVRATGPLRDPQIIGRAVLKDTTLAHMEFPYSLSAVEGDLTFSRNTVRLEGVQGKFASGALLVRGTLEHQNAVIRSLNLQIMSRGARLPYPKDFRTSLNADVVLRGTADSQVLTGNIDILRAEYIREFNLLEQLASRSVSTPGPLVTDPLLAGIRFNVAIRSSEGLVIDNELLRLQGRIALTLRGTPAYPSVVGRVEATEGSIFFRGNRFEILHASADFLDQSRVNPIFEIRAEADVKSYRLLLEVNGDLDRLRSNLRSDPPLTTVDIVTLLATGKEREERQSSRREAEITGVSAASILSESLTGVIGKRVQRLFGLESFRVDPFLAGSENDPTARITITERLSRDLSVTFSRNLSTNEEQIVVVEYDVTRNFSILGTRDEDGKLRVDFRFRKRFR